MMQQIILIGFNRVGKTHIGRHLAAKLNKTFIDFDDEMSIENIMYGSYVISLNDSIALSPTNRDIIKSHFVIHVTASRGIVFERIMMTGRPAFFHPETDILDAFMQLWNEREPAYRNMSSYTIDNNYTLEHAVDQAISYLQSS